MDNTLNRNKPHGPSAAIAAAVIVALLLPGCAETGSLRERAQEIKAAVVAKIRKMRGLEPAPKPPLPPLPAPGPVPETAKVEPAAPAAPAVSAAPAAAERAKAPVSAGGLNVRGTCRARDETGYAESIDLEVIDGQVNQLTARVDVPRRGACRFELAEFRQGLRTPHVELAALSDPACVLRMWEQGGRVTVAASDCAQKCTRQSFDYVWPFELDSTSGSCSK